MGSGHSGERHTSNLGPEFNEQDRSADPHGKIVQHIGYQYVSCQCNWDIVCASARQDRLRHCPEPRD